MTTLTCPKCRLGMSDAALDAGQCPACGFPLDGPLVLDVAAHRRSPALLVAVAGAVVATGVASYAFLQPTDTPAADHDITGTPDAGPPAVAVRHVAPFPHLPKPPDAPDAKSTPEPRPVVELPKKAGPRPIGVVMKIDPKIAPSATSTTPTTRPLFPT